MIAKLIDKNTIDCAYGQYYIDDEMYKLFEVPLLDDTERYKVEILHNYEFKPMLDIVDTFKNKSVLRLEVNTLKFKDVVRWMTDENYKNIDMLKIADSTVKISNFY